MQEQSSTCDICGRTFDDGEEQAGHNCGDTVRYVLATFPATTLAEATAKLRDFQRRTTALLNTAHAATTWDDLVAIYATSPHGQAAYGRYLDDWGLLPSKGGPHPEEDVYALDPFFTYEEWIQQIHDAGPQADAEAEGPITQFLNWSQA